VGDKLLGLDVDRRLTLNERIPQDKPGPAARRAVFTNVRELAAGQFLGKFLRVGNRGRGKQKLRARAVVCADAAEPAYELRHVGAKNPTVPVRLVNDAVAQVAVELLPLMVIGENLVQFVRIGEHEA
jgi:hypothetical protein